MWYLATVINGTEIEGFETGRRVYVQATGLGTIRVIGAKGITAIVRIDYAAKHLARVRRDGKPVVVRDQSIRWDQLRGWRRFDQRNGKFDVAA